MIRSLYIENYTTGYKTLIDIARPEDSGLVIKSISGLGPGKANVNTTDISAYDGSFYYSTRVPQRNIVLSFILLENPTIEYTRAITNKLFVLGSMVHLEIYTDAKSVQTDCRVESNSPDIFSSQESVEVSLICPDPYLYSIKTKSISITKILGALEDDIAQIDYKGDVPIGADIDISFHDKTISDSSALQHETLSVYKHEFLSRLTNNSLKNPDDLWHIDTNQTQNVELKNIVYRTENISESFRISNIKLTEDYKLSINTKNGQKSCTYNNSNILKNVTIMSDWINIYPGRNIISMQLQPNNFISFGAADIIIKYQEAYLGI